MNAKKYILAIDQGTTSSRVVLYDLATGVEIKSASRPLICYFPEQAWVEQNPKEIWQSVKDCLLEVLGAVDAKEIATIGITNQRETVIAWDKKTGESLCPAIVWQCRRTADICKRLRKQGLENKIKDKTGLVLDPYFSGTKILWMIENVPGLRERVNSGEVVFGTVDSWVLFNLTKESGHDENNRAVIATESSNASRTMLCSLKDGAWDSEMMALFQVTEENLPEIKNSDADFGFYEYQGTKIPITGILGDQQASLFGHGCLKANSIKCTFGTGAFLLMNTGGKILYSPEGLLTTIAWKTSRIKGLQKDLCYALEGSVFMAGALIQWLRDKLGIIESSKDSERIASSVEDSGGVIVVPAFVGLGAPYWDASARGTIFGLTRDSGRGHIVRAALEGVAHQVADITDGMQFKNTAEIRIDGGMTANKLFSQTLADYTGKKIKVSNVSETTAFGAGSIAGLAVGALSLESEWFQQNVSRVNFENNKPADLIRRTRKVWALAVEKTKNWLTN